MVYRFLRFNKRVLNFFFFYFVSKTVNPRIKIKKVLESIDSIGGVGKYPSNKKSQVAKKTVILHQVSLKFIPIREYQHTYTFGQKARSVNQMTPYFPPN